MSEGRRPVGIAVAAAIALLAAIVLAGMGRTIWCGCGSLVPWSWDIWSRHNSQHLLDPYSFTHVLHGVVFYALARALAGRAPLDVRFALAVAAESAWEVVENTDRVITHYREATISLDYYGDSVLNSLSDITAAALGFFVASRLPWWGSLAMFVAFEIALALWIRDSLVLNVVMLLYPIEAIRSWQMGG